MNNLLIIIFFITLSSILLYYNNRYKYTKSLIDGRYYKTKNNHLAQKSADSLATINLNLNRLVNYIKQLEVKPRYFQRLGNFNPSVIEENIFDIDTSYTINKGSYVVFCLAPRDVEDNRVYDINTLMYVAIHELSHIVSFTLGHTEEFKDNFKNLLEHAIRCGVYKHVDYSKKPQEYCGILINKNAIQV